MARPYVAERRTNKLGTILELKLRRCERHGGSYRDGLNPHAYESTTRLYSLADTTPTAAKNDVTINDTASTQLDTRATIAPRSYDTTNSGDDYEYFIDNNDNDVDMTSQPAIHTMMHDGRGVANHT